MEKTFCVALIRALLRQSKRARIIKSYNDFCHQEITVLNMEGSTQSFDYRSQVVMYSL